MATPIMTYNHTLHRVIKEGSEVGVKFGYGLAFVA